MDPVLYNNGFITEHECGLAFIVGRECSFTAHSFFVVLRSQRVLYDNALIASGALDRWRVESRICRSLGNELDGLSYPYPVLYHNVSLQERMLRLRFDRVPRVALPQEHRL